MKFTRRDSFQRGSLRRVDRAKGRFAWEFRYRVRENGVPTLKQLTLCGEKYPTEAAVRRKLESKVIQLNENKPITEPTMGAVIDCYIEQEKLERAKSWQNYLLLMNRHIRPVWGGFRLSDVRPRDVEIWLKSLAHSPETKRHIKSMMYRLFEYAMMQQWMEIQRNPMSLVRVKGRSRVVEKVVLTPDQMLTVRANLPYPYRLMAEMCCYLGLRICEVLGLKWEDFDLASEQKTLTIRRSAVDGAVGDVKTEASRDEIPLSENFVSLLMRWKRVAPPSEEGWVFPSDRTGRPFHAGILLRNYLVPLAPKIGVSRLGWHTFRHTFRSWLDSVGTAVGVQQKMMRHADVATTMNIYGKGMMDSKLEAHTKLLEYAGVGFCGGCRI